MIGTTRKSAGSSFFGFGSVPVGVADARGFIQSRMASYFKIVALISTAFLLTNLATSRIFLHELADTLEQRFDAVHIGTSLLTFALWLYCRSGQRSELALHKVDSAGTLAICAGFSAMTWGQPASWRPEYSSLFAVFMTLTCRTALVPSNAARTLKVSLISLLPILAVTYAIYAGAAPARGVPSAALATYVAAKWVVAAAAMTCLISGIMYGLQRQVQKAMQLGQYTLEERLGEGGMGVVYKARHALLRRPTAIKLLPLEKAGDVALARFEREVQLTSKLTHPNTIAIYDFGRTPDGMFYYVMEYLEGLDLQTLVEQHGPQPPSRVVHILRQACGALNEAHGLGLIHRDIKPANIYLCERGALPDFVKVLDFGLVKRIGTEAVGVSLSTHDGLTGTPLYLSPEAITHPETIDARADLYALGAVGYFLLTGEHVFAGTSLIQVCSDHLHTKPIAPSQRLGAPVPPGLEALLLACLEKDPEKRPQNARSLEAALAGCADVKPWDEAAAVAWWTDRASGTGPRRQPVRDSASLRQTVAVDLATREVIGMIDMA